MIAYSDVQPDDECLRNDGVVLINSLTFQVTSNIKQNGRDNVYPLFHFDSNRVLMGVIFF